MTTSTRSFGRIWPTPESNAIDAIAFARHKNDRSRGTLLVQFSRSGSTYYYADVSRSLWELAREIARCGGASIWRTIHPLLQRNQVAYTRAIPTANWIRREALTSARVDPLEPLRRLYLSTHNLKLRAFAREVA